MADVEGSALGLSIGATNLAAVTADRAVTRKPVLTLYRQRPPEVGVPIGEPEAQRARVGDQRLRGPRRGSGRHRGRRRQHASQRDFGRRCAAGPGVHRHRRASHCRMRSPSPIPRTGMRTAVDSVRVALSRVSEWSRGRLALLPDSTAALFALQAEPGPAEQRNHCGMRLRRVRSHCQPGRRRERLSGHRPGRANGRLLRRPDRSGGAHPRRRRSVVGGFVRLVGNVGDRLAEQAADRLPVRQRTALLDDGDRVDRRGAWLSWRDPAVPRRARGCDPSAAARLHRLLARSAGAQWNSPG